MGQVYHGSATTTAAVRRAIRHSQETLTALAQRCGIQLETAAKWKKRTSTGDRKTGPADPRSMVLSAENKAVVVAFRKHTVLPLEDCLYALQPTIPHLTRSSLHRWLQRHGISRLPDVEGDKPGKKTFKSYPIGHVHIDIAEVRTAEGKLCPKAGKVVAAEFLSDLIAAVPYAIHTVLTDNGVQFTNRARDRTALHHIFDCVCDENDIEHRFTTVKHPWTNGQVERMNRTIKEATVKRFHCGDHAQLRQHLTDVIDAYNFGPQLKILKDLTPYEAICKQWISEPQRFRLDATHQLRGRNT